MDCAHPASRRTARARQNAIQPEVEIALASATSARARTPLPPARGTSDDDGEARPGWPALQPTYGRGVAPGALAASAGARRPVDDADHDRRAPAAARHRRRADQGAMIGGTAASIVGKYEGIDPAVRPAFARACSPPSTRCTSTRAPSASALALHADSHDVTILGVSARSAGRCSPPDGGAWWHCRGRRVPTSCSGAARPTQRRSTAASSQCGKAISSTFREAMRTSHAPRSGSAPHHRRRPRRARASCARLAGGGVRGGAARRRRRDRLRSPCSFSSWLVGAAHAEAAARQGGVGMHVSLVRVEI